MSSLTRSAYCAPMTCLSVSAPEFNFSNQLRARMNSNERRYGVRQHDEKVVVGSLIAVPNSLFEWETATVFFSLFPIQRSTTNY